MAWWVAHMQTVCRDLGTARTPDGYTFYRQPDSTWCDGAGDMVYTSRMALMRVGARFTD